jgi:hypothetical protein
MPADFRDGLSAEDRGAGELRVLAKTPIETSDSAV